MHLLEPNKGLVLLKYTGTNSNESTVSHGLETAPSFYIYNLSQTVRRLTTGQYITSGLWTGNIFDLNSIR